jgi:hypothetical protein
MTTLTNAVTNEQAHLVISDAFERFRNTVEPKDIQLLDNTTVEDVQEAMATIQRGLLDRRENRNLRPLEPFLQGLKTYGQAIDVLSNGLSPFLPWAWSPVRLMLQVRMSLYP